MDSNCITNKLGYDVILKGVKEPLTNKQEILIFDLIMICNDYDRLKKYIKSSS